MTKPEYPIKVKFFKEGEECEYKNELEMATDLEWFDSEDKENSEDLTLVTDRLGREVILKIEALELIKFELKN